MVILWFTRSINYHWDFIGFKDINQPQDGAGIYTSKAQYTIDREIFTVKIFRQFLRWQKNFLRARLIVTSWPHGQNKTSENFLREKKLRKNFLSYGIY